MVSRTVHADLLFTATLDPSIGTDGHIPDADSRSCQLVAGLWEQHAGWHSSLPHAQTAVSSERCGTAHFHLRRSDQITDALVSHIGCVYRSESNSRSPC